MCEKFDQVTLAGIIQGLMKFSKWASQSSDV